VISNTPSSVNSSINGSVYGDTTNDHNPMTDSSFISEREISIKQLQKQQQELLRMQNLINQKMSNIQSAIHQKDVRENKSTKVAPKAAKGRNSCDLGKMSKAVVTVGDYSCKSVMRSSCFGKKEPSVPLFKSDPRSKSTIKQRRSRQTRVHEMSMERTQQFSKPRGRNDSQRLGISTKQEFPAQNVYQNNTATTPYNDSFVSKIPMLRQSHSRLRSGQGSKERMEVVNEVPIIVSRCVQINKAAVLINRKTFENLRVIRPIQSSIKVIRSFIKTMKIYNPKLNFLKETEHWAKLTYDLCKHSSILVKEIKELSLRCKIYQTPHPVIIEAEQELFSSKQKNVPACSTAFQRELKPFSNLLQSLINYYNGRERSVENRSSSRNKSACKSRNSGFKSREKSALRPSNTVKQLEIPEQKYQAKGNRPASHNRMNMTTNLGRPQQTSTHELLANKLLKTTDLKRESLFNKKYYTVRRSDNVRAVQNSNETPKSDFVHKLSSRHVRR